MGALKDDWKAIYRELGPNQWRELVIDRDKRIAELERQRDNYYALAVDRFLENQRLREAIDTHNAGVKWQCDERKKTGYCANYEAIGRNCTDCPMDYEIELEG